MKVNILCIGDIVGRPGRRILSEKLKAFIAERNIDCVIANAENSAGGSGITPPIYEKLLRCGINLIPQKRHHTCSRKRHKHRKDRKSFGAGSRKGIRDI
jgi:hypothetical protein